MQAQARAKDAYDVDLPTLALLAAIQLNRLIERKQADSGVIEDFLAELGQFSEVWTDHDPKHLARNPTAFSLLNAAIREIPGPAPCHGRDLGARMMNLIEEYQNSAKTGQVLGLQHMRAFCLALHDIMSADRVPIHDSETAFNT